MISLAHITRQLIETAETSINIGDGFTLQCYGKVYKLVRAGTNTILGGVAIYQYDPGQGMQPLGMASTVPAVRDIWLDDSIRKTGVGRLMLSALIKRYGSLRSDPTGQTSASAERMWRALGAVSLTTQDKGYGDSWFALPNP